MPFPGPSGYLCPEVRVRRHLLQRKAGTWGLWLLGATESSFECVTSSQLAEWPKKPLVVSRAQNRRLVQAAE